MTATAPGTPQAAIFVEETGAHRFQRFAVEPPPQETPAGLGLSG